MMIIGLTGGIGCGKSTVAGYFAQLGVPVLDADRIARELVIPGSPALDEIVDAFGSDMRLPDGNLDRPRLRQRVFAEPTQRRRLENILHPRIYAEMRRRTLALRSPYCIWVIPLLLETEKTSLVDRILVVDTPEALQRQRVMARDDMDDATLQGILRSQVDRRQRLRAADDIIANTADLGHLQQQVTTLHHRYLSLAQALASRRKSD